MNRHLPTAESRIDLTPMLDVVFIMLIFFIVTASFIREVGIDLNPPDPDQITPPNPDKEIILVRITSASRLIVGDVEVDVRSIGAHLERLHAQNPEAPLVIKLHGESTTGAMVRVMDSARDIGIYDIRFAT